MVCSACGYENQVGTRFCGMCGTPLPHRPLTAPGAQGTHNLTRVPLENATPARPGPAAASPQDASPSAPPSRTGALLELRSGRAPASEPSRPISADSPAAQTPKLREIVAKQQPPSTDAPTVRDMVPEVPLDEYVKSFRYVPPADSEEITMPGEAQTLKQQVPVVTDTPATGTKEKVTVVDAGSVPPSEDVRQRLGLEAVPGEERRDRPRFLDFGEPPPPPPGRSLQASTVVGPSTLGSSDAPPIAAEPTEETQIGKPSRGNWRIVIAAAALVFTVLGVLEWRSRVNHTNDGPVEAVKMRIQSMRHGDSQAPQPAGRTDSNTSDQVIQVGAQPKPQVQNQDEAAKSDVSSSASGSSPSAPPHANAGTTAGNPAQKTTATGGDQPPAGQKTTPPKQIASMNGALPVAGQDAAGQKATPPATSANAVPASVAPDVAHPATEKPKPKPQAAQDEDQEVTIIPGEEELAKAKNASDSAAAAAWLAKATARGNPDAPVRLADMYIKGNGVPRSCEQALALLKTAATKDNARACNRLASLYTSGTCVQRNRVEAYRWLSAALDADPDSHWAQQNRELIWRQMTPEERTAVEQYR